MMTLKEFEDHFFHKGISKQWGRGEWRRRHNDKAGMWTTDLAPDCKLPRVQLYGHTVERSGKEASATDQVELSTKAVKNPKVRNVGALLDGLG